MLSRNRSLREGYETPSVFGIANFPIGLNTFPLLLCLLKFFSHHDTTEIACHFLIKSLDGFVLKSCLSDSDTTL